MESCGATMGEVSEEEFKAGVPYINNYCETTHRGVVHCEWTPAKGRILRSRRGFEMGEIIFREPPLHIVAEKHGNLAFEKIKELCRTQSSTFEYEALWYWTALCSLVRGQLPPGEDRLRPIDDDQQTKLLLLFHAEVTKPSEAASRLVTELGLSQLEPLDLERLLQVWILNCFEHSDDPLGYSTYFMSSFMSHSCLPNAVWHYDGDDFILRARGAIDAGDEISVSYLSEDVLLESVPRRRKQLKDSKHFVCTCIRCTAELDLSRGFVLARASGGVCFAAAAASGRELVGGSCSLSSEETGLFLQEEQWFERKLDGFERRVDRSPGKHSNVVGLIEESVARAEKTLAQHFLMDKAWHMLGGLYERNGCQAEAEALLERRVAFQARAYPGLSGTRAWTLEALADMMLHHAGAFAQQRVVVPSSAVAQELAAKRVPGVYSECLDTLRLMFGAEHEHYTAVSRKATELQREMDRHLSRAKS